MAKVHPVTLKLQTEGFAGIKGIGQDFKKFSSTVKATKPQLDRFIKGITKVHGNTKLSKVAFEGQISAIKKLRDNVGIGTVAYKRLGEELDRVTAKMNKALGVQQKSAGFFGKLGPGATAAIGGAGAYIGGSLGISPAISGLGAAGAAASASKAGVGILSKAGAVGGLQGAAVGGVIAGVGAGVQFGAESARYAADIQKLQIALKGVTKNQKDFTKGLDVISKTSKRLNVPIAASTRQFTTLSASVLGAGGTIEDAEEVFTGVSNAIKATGGNAEDVQSAIRAMSQIFGKGKVSAEELQGQLGERLAGAVVKFAEANGSSLQKLQKDLRDGTVGLGQIMKFAEKLNKDFAKTAEEVSDSSADAGQRLKTSMDRLKLAVGTILQPIGAEFQKVFGNIVNAITDAIEAFNEFMGIGLGNAIKKTQKAIEDLNARIAAAEERGNDKLARRLKLQRSQKNANLAILTEGLGEEGGNKTSNLPDATTPPSEDTINKYKLDLGIITKQEFESLQLKIQSKKILDAMKAANKDFSMSQDEIIAKLKESADETFNFKEKFKELIDSTTDLQTNIGNFALDFTNKLGDAFADFFVEGKRGFADLARSAVQELNKIIVKAAFMKFIANPILGFLGLKSADGNVIDGGEVVPSAKGNIFAKNKIVPYAYGGIVNKPTLFPMANGMGLMAEAGPEAIMPLKRGRGGKLGVIAQGAGIGSIVVNVDASGSSVEGDEEQGKQLGLAISAAVQSEILQQKRPGGLLA